ncbi:MAGE family-domain-containing protein [Delphinella strobiligena]|nr:MAGE family-domain-containing protein [Delphinella strobiligena]
MTLLFSRSHLQVLENNMPLVRKRRVPTADEASEVSDVAPEPQRQRRRQSAASDHDDDFTQAVEGNTHTKQMVKNLVRLALACEYSRTPIRRADITSKVLGAQTRQFKMVFSEAQSELKAVFGMQMTELPLREKVTLQQRRAAQKSASTQKSSGAWVLTSVLPSKFRVPEILAPPQAPSTEAEAQYVGTYTFVVALILLSGGALSDSRLDKYLKRASVDDTTTYSGSAAYNGLDMRERLLKRMEKDGYVVKIRDTSTGEETIDWIVGPRGKTEVGEQGVAGLIKAVYGDMEGDEAAELSRKVERSLGVAEKKTQSTQPQPGENRRRGPRRAAGDNEGEEEQDVGSEVDE